MENIIQKPLLERWRDKAGAEDENGCWPWIGAKTHYGYGKIRKNHKQIGAHRISYELHIGKIPKGMSVLHSCDNPGCVNPKHLFLGTQSDNLKDMFKKGRNKNQYDYDKNFINGKTRPVEALVDGKWVCFQSMTQGAIKTGANLSKISMAVNGLRSKAGGLKWRTIKI